MKIKVETPMKVKSLNKVGPYTHWGAYANYKKKWLAALGFVLPKIDPPILVKRIIRITSTRKRLLDHDNLVGGCKPIMDTLKKQGYIVDDAQQWVSVKYIQRIGKPETTTVEIR